jgi:hypothetical protein
LIFLHTNIRDIITGPLHYETGGFGPNQVATF